MPDNVKYMCVGGRRHRVWQGPLEGGGEVGINITNTTSTSNRLFLKRHFEKNKNPTKYATWLDLGKIYPEGEDDRTSQGGRQRHLKFGKSRKSVAAALIKNLQHNSPYRGLLLLQGGDNVASITKAAAKYCLPCLAYVP